LELFDEGLGLCVHHHQATRKVVQTIRQIPGVAKADALFGSPDAIAIVEGEDIASMDAVIDSIVEVPEVDGTESKVARWIG
jgi:DNA-binding Lrp family transcriptional regulator